MPGTLRARFDRELAGLIESVIVLGAGAHRAVASALQAFLDNDVDAAAEVISGDQEVNNLRYEIEQRCYALLAREQPVAGDMRTIMTVLSVAGELERIADHGKKIARICQRISAEPRAIPLDPISRMGEMALAMLFDTMGTISSRDLAAARAVSARDDQVDALYKQVFNLTLSYMLESSRAISSGTHVIQVAHEIERIADRTTNIAERVIYAVSGELVDLNA